MTVTIAEVAQIAQQNDGRVVLPDLLGLHQRDDPLPRPVALPGKIIKSMLTGHGCLTLRLRLLALAFLGRESGTPFTPLARRVPQLTDSPNAARLGTGICRELPRRHSATMPNRSSR